MKANVTCLLILLAGLSSNAQDSANFYHKKGLEEKANRRYLVASAHFDKAIKFNPKYIDAYIENGNVNLSMRRTDAAKNYFNKVVELDPNNNVAIQQLMELYYNYHQYQKAIEYAQKCKSCDASQKTIGMSNYKLEDYGKAEQGLKAYLSKSPADGEATYALARTYEQLGNMQNAVSHYVKSIQIEPTRYTWTYELACAYYSMNDFENAAVYFNKAAESGYPQNSEFRENLGFTYIYAGNFEAGEKILLDQAAKKPGSKEILRLVVDAYYQRKNYDKALEFCQKLLEMDKNDATALYQAGLCFQKKGQVERGQQMCDKAIDMDPSLNSLRKQKMSAGL